MQRRTAEGMARLQLRDQAVARGQSPATISDESIDRLARAIEQALARSPVQAVVDPTAGVHAATSGSRSGGGGE